MYSVNRKFCMDRVPELIGAFMEPYQEASGLEFRISQAVVLPLLGLALKDDHLAAVNLGCMCKAEVYVDKNLKRALEFFLIAAKSDSLSVACEIGSIYGASTSPFYNIDKAFRYFWEAAEAGDAAAQFNVGVILSQRKGKMGEAVQWYEKAVANNHAGACINLAIIYTNGHADLLVKNNDVPRALERARNLFQQAVELGCPTAQEALEAFEKLVKASSN